MSQISITKNPTYDLDQVTQSVRLHFARFGLDKKLGPQTKVLLKPNLLMKRRPEEFTTTHPALVEGAILVLKEYGVQEITLADSPGGLYTPSALKGIYSTCGMEEVCSRQGVRLNFDTGFQQVHREEGRLVKTFPLINPVCQADFILDLCKLKTHAMTGLSGGVKNLFGTIPGLTKPEFHWRFPEKEQFCSMLIDLCETVKPDFVLVDAVESMEGNGPSGGQKRTPGLILASDQPYDLDFCLCHLIGLDPARVKTVEESVRRGLCCGDLSQIQVLGEPLQPIPDYKLPRDARTDFTSHVPPVLAKPIKKLTQVFLTSHPAVRQKDCIGCGKCAESCPAKTITIENRKAQINLKNCIHCFCCHEMCPVKAIDIRRSRLFSGFGKK